jgi:hypothetical protein
MANVQDITFFTIGNLTINRGEVDEQFDLGEVLHTAILRMEYEK